MLDPAAIWSRLDEIHRHNQDSRDLLLGILETQHRQHETQIRTLELIGVIMTAVQVEQEDIDALTTAVSTANTALGTVEQTLASLVNSLEQQVASGQPLPEGNLTQAQAAVAALQEVTAAFATIEPVAPTPAPTPTPAPEASAPVVSSVAPASGTVNGGDTVTVTGTGFTDATAVNFGDVPASSFTVNSDTEIAAVTPAPVTGAGTVDITVVTASGTSTTGSDDQFTTS